MAILSRETVLAGLRAAERLRLGDLPGQADLDLAPKLSAWSIQPLAGGLHHLIGTVTGHPTIPDGPINTSAILVIDPGRRWARTVSRIYLREQSLEQILASSSTDSSPPDAQDRRNCS